jgi:hypothetical protein
MKLTSQDRLSDKKEKAMSNSDRISLQQAIRDLYPPSEATDDGTRNATGTKTVEAGALEERRLTTPPPAITHQDQVDKQAQKYLQLSLAFYQDTLGQSQQSFRFAVIAAGVGLAFFLLGLIALFIKLPGSATADTVNAYAAIVPMVAGAIAGLVSGTCFYVYGVAASQFSAFHARLDRLQRYFMAESFCGCITDGTNDLACKTMAKLVKTMANASMADTQMYVQPLQAWSGNGNDQSNNNGSNNQGNNNNNNGGNNNSQGNNNNGNNNNQGNNSQGNNNNNGNNQNVERPLPHVG